MSECLTTQLDPDVNGRIIGVQAQMATFNVLFWAAACHENPQDNG